ncbi:MAG: Zn-dependent protease [Bacteroidales bacterium]|nr:Zn-dependent protease [Bacteroidales bacterium]
MNTGDKNVIVNIQPFSGIPDEYVAYVYDELKKVYPFISLRKPIKLPELAYNSHRNRYRADSLIRFLKSRTPDGEVTIGLTRKDISYTKGEIADYGIMGLGYMPGQACVVSCFRLNKEKIKIQLFKVTIPELGHTQGLPHCRVKTCYMRSAEGKNHTDEEDGFCKDCKKFLVSKGWKFEN